MRFSLMQLYVPVRASDGKGGFTVTTPVAQDFYGAIKVHEGVHTLICRSEVSLSMENLLLASGAWYRFVGFLGTIGAPFREVTIERIAKPIVP